MIISESLIACNELFDKTSPSITTGPWVWLIFKLPLSSSRNDLYKSIKYLGAELSVPKGNKNVSYN